MYSVIETEEFSEWLAGLKDVTMRLRWIKRLRRASLGQLGDVKPVGDGVWEMRELFGPGWRMYDVHRGDIIVLMLGGGDKSTQQRDIRRAQLMAKEV